MPRVQKSSITQFVGTGCERQLRLSLHPDTRHFAHERVALNMPHRQVRPALREIQNAGDEWGESKVHDLHDAFGPANVLGGAHTQTGSTTQPGIRYQPSQLLPFLNAGVAAGQFLVETEYRANTATFRAAHNLDTITFAEVSGPLSLTRARPDVIEVLAPTPGAKAVTVNGDIVPIDSGDSRLLLRIIDVKLTSEPGPRYFAELAYYALTLAAFLTDAGLDDRYIVSAQPAIWPGTETESALQTAVSNTASPADRYAAFQDDLEVVPMRAFLAHVRRILRVDIPHVLATPLADLPWSVTPACQGCEYLGQKFSDVPGTSGSAWDPRHCLPEAESTQHLSRLPFLTRGALQVLRTHGTQSVVDVAGMATTDATFDLHHRLRGQREIVSRRAQALNGAGIIPLDADVYATAAIPKFARLRIYLTADFDPGSALSLSFGLSWGWLDRNWQPSSISRSRVHHTTTKTADAEWDALSGLLDDIAALLAECTAHDRRQTVQVYVWDTVTFEHMTRVIGRHLERILASNRLQNLVWLFPPDQMLDNPALTEAPVVSIVRNAAKATLALNVAHTYTLLTTARALEPAGSTRTFTVPRFWEDPFTDQIPPERAHQVWNQRRAPSAPTSAELATRLSQTVKTKLRALEAVTSELTDELRDRITRRAPELRQLAAPTIPSATSPLGVLLVAYAKLDRAVTKLDRAQIRALPTEEKEAKFESAVMERLVGGTSKQRALAALGLTDEPNRRVFRLREGSQDVRVKAGEFLWALVPEEIAVELDTSVRSIVNRMNDPALTALFDSLDGFYQRVSLGDVLESTVVAIDRNSRIIVLDLSTFRDHPRLRRQLSAAGFFTGRGAWTLEAVSKDFFVKRLEDATRAIGNPPESTRDPLINSALGRAINPRVGAAHPAGALIWDTARMSMTTVPRDVTAARTALPTVIGALNASQDTAWEEALTTRASLIWGPPGTGKTATLRAILNALAQDDQPLRIAVAASTYTAIDTVLERLIPDLRAFAPDVRVRRVSSGSRDTPAWLPADMNIERNQSTFDDLLDELDEDETTIVFGTTAQLHEVTKQRGERGTRETFDVMVIDEAGQLDVAQAMLLLSGAAPDAQLIVAGDHLQLSPIHAAEAPLGLENKVGSIYTYLLEEQGVPQKALLVNYRSNSTLVELGKRAGYPDALTAHTPDIRIRYDTPILDAAQAALDLSDELVSIADPDHVAVALTYIEGVSGQWNDFEARTVVDLVRWYREVLIARVTGHPIQAMTDEYFWTEAVGVVSLHRAQRSRIIDLLRAEFVVPGADARMSDWIESAVDTVERFQGQERDVIIASYAVGDPDTVAEEEEFLHNLNRFNVLATRARAKLIVMASREIIQHTSNDLDTIRASEMLKDFVDVFCVNEEVVALQSADGDVVTEFRWRT